MTTTKSMLNILCAAAFVAFGSGCSTTSTTRNSENMLSAAGFKAIPANTPQREEHLRSLPADSLTVANLNGHNYFIFPDPAENVLFVGQQPQYQQYQRMRLDNQMALAQVNTISVDDDWTRWTAWGRRW
jgi:hypothetical protein